MDPLSNVSDPCHGTHIPVYCVIPGDPAKTYYGGWISYFALGLPGLIDELVYVGHLCLAKVRTKVRRCFASVTTYSNKNFKLSKTVTRDNW
jgi:hypothetical protein